MINERFAFWALAMLAILVLTVSGCSDKDRDQGKAATDTAPVSFVFDLEAATKTVEVAPEVTEFGFFGYSDTECQNEVYSAYVNKVEELESKQQTITLDVPVNVVKIKINYYDKSREVLAVSVTDTLQLEAGVPLVIEVSKDAPAQYGCIVVLHFADDIDIPDTTIRCQVNMYNADNKLLLTDSFNVTPSTLQNIAIDEVPAEVAAIDILWQNAQGTTVGAHQISGKELPELSVGKTVQVTVTGQAQMEISNLSLEVSNIYSEAPAKANASITYNSECAINRTVSVKGVSVTAGSCTCAALGLLGKEVQIVSVVLTDPANSIPFEWLDYSEGKKAVAGKLSLDVETNEFANGNYSEGTAMMVANPRQFMNISKYLDGKYQQTQNIDFAGSCGITLKEDGSIDATKTVTTARYYNMNGTQATNYVGYAPIGSSATPFKGEYNGGGFSISKVVGYSEEPSRNIALFNYAQGDFNHLILDNTCGMTGSNVASLVANVSGTINLNGCQSSASLFASGTYAGGLVTVITNQNFTINNCSFTGSLKASAAKHVGGIVSCAISISDGKIAACQNRGHVSTAAKLDSSIGGILGSVNSSTLTLSDCVNESDITNDYGIGGIIGDASGSQLTVENCTNKGTLTLNEKECGGILGYSAGDTITFRNCHNEGTITGAGYYVGGIIGEIVNGSKITCDTCTNSGTLDAEDYLGGLLGIDSTGYTGTTLTITDCKIKGTLKNADNAGGLFGSSNCATLTLTGKNAIECAFVFNECENVGGCFGEYVKYQESAESLKQLLKASGIIMNSYPQYSEEYKNAKYCGDPLIDT